MKEKENIKKLPTDFEVVIHKVEGKYIGECRELPGLIVSGKDSREVMKNIKAAIPLYLKYVPKESFIPVYENKDIPVIYDFEEFNGYLYASTNKDTVIRTSTGDIGAWELISISNIFSPYFNPPVGHTKSFEDEQLGDYTPQVYCLKAFNDLGTPKLFCGTNANGGIYETLDGKTWSLSFNSGEARVHCLEIFKGRLFAGTSTEGKIYSYNGTHWVISLNTSELAATTFGLFRDYLYAGTYPNGVIYRTADGVNWQKVFDTNQSFVNDFFVFKNRLFCSTSKSTGGLIFMSEDGINWVENFFSEKDINFFKFASFSNSLYVGSGDSGRIFKTTDGKKWEVAFQTDEEDVRILKVFNGYLYFGSSPRGRIFRTTISNVPPPKVMDVRIDEITSHSAVINWTTDKEANTIIEYGTDLNYGFTVIKEEKSIIHKLTLTNLKALTKYHFRLLPYTDIGSFSGVADDWTFTTTAAVTPVLTSRTHPSQDEWYNKNEVDIYWGIHPEIKNYLYVIDKNPDTKPDPAKCEVTTSDSVLIKGLEDGIWYFHLLIEDKAGNISPTVSHYRIKIDTVALPPKVTSPTHPDSERWYNTAPVFTWEEPEDMSGIAGYYYLIDELPNTVPNEKIAQWTEEKNVKLGMLEDGTKYFHIISKDKAGNIGTRATHYKFNIDTQALNPIINSRTHPDQLSWYNNTDITIHISKPHDLSGIDGFYYLVNRIPDYEPSETELIFTEQTDIEIKEKTDGTWYIHVKSKDLAGNISRGTSHFRFNIDTQALPPNISSITHPDPQRWYNIKRAQFKISPADDLSGIAGYFYVIDNNEKTIPDEKSSWTDKDIIFSGDLKDGTWYLHVISKDKAGNTGRQASHFMFNIDTVAKPPFVYSTTHKDQEAWYKNPIPQIQWDTPEDMSGIEGYYYTVDQKHSTIPLKDSSEWTVANQITLPQLQDGIWYFHIIAKDNAGNIGPEASHFKIKIDTTVEQPKISSLTHPDENKWYNTGLIKFTWTVPSDLSKIKDFYYLFSKERHIKITPDMAVKTDKREVDIVTTEQGVYYFHLIAEDNAGNIGEEPAVYTVHLDFIAAPPEVISTTHPNSEKYYSEKYPVFVVEKVDDLSGVDGFYYKVDRKNDTIPDKKEGRFTKDGTIKINEPLDDGEWYFHIVLKDKAGNIGTEAFHYKFKVETNPPEVKIKELPEFVNSESFEVEWDAEDKESGVFVFTVEYKEGDKGKWKLWLKETKERKAVFKGEDAITYYFRIKARDNAGNWSDYYENNSIKTTIDVSPPSAITQIVARPLKEGNILIEWTKAVDSVSGVDYYRIYRSTVSGQVGMQICDDGAVKENKFIDDSRELEDGIIYYYTVRAVDKVGNERESGNKQILVVCDKFALPPVVKSFTHPIQDAWYNNKDVKLSWDTPQDATKITGYYYIFDQNPTTKPDAKTGTWYIDNEIDLNNVSDGTWYFHIISKDEAGNLSDEAYHYQINIDTTLPKPPVVSSITHPDFNRWYNNNTPSFTWTIPSDPAGIEGYYYIFNQIKDSVPDLSSASWTKGTMASFVDVPDGIWYFHIVAKDNASNISQEAFHMQIKVAMTPPPPEVFSMTHQDQNRWYREKNVRLQWKPPEYVNDIIGFFYVLDNLEDTVPTTKNSKTMDTSITFQNLSDGIWYFHIVSVDKEGVIGKTANHYRIKIKTKVTVKGTITQSNGIMPQPGATVEIMQEDGTTLGIAISDKEGNFVVDNLPVGKIKIKIVAKGLPPQMLYDIELKADEPERIINISTEIFAIYEKASDKFIFSYYIPEDGLVTIKIYNETGKLLHTIEEKKKGKIYNSSSCSWANFEPGLYMYQITSKGDTSGKLTKYAIRKIRKE